MSANKELMRKFFSETLPQEWEAFLDFVVEYDAKTKEEQGALKLAYLNSLKAANDDKLAAIDAKFDEQKARDQAAIDAENLMIDETAARITGA
tara:strand:- start:1357 stop:1635 length:279 start_codon:yes stop_codon:yes gene_type:complete